MFRIALLASAICVSASGVWAQPVSSTNAIIPQGTGLTVGNPAGGPQGPGVVNAESYLLNGSALSGGVAIPTAQILGGTPSAYVPITVGTNLNLDPTSHILTATGGASLPTSAPLVGSNSGGSGVTITPANGLTISGGSLIPTFGTSANTIAQGNDSRIVGALQSVPAPTTSVLGGLLATTAQSGQFVSFIDTSGVQHFATPAGGGNVSAAGTPTSGQIAVWTGATTAQGASSISGIPIAGAAGAFTTLGSTGGYTDTSTNGISTIGGMTFGGGTNGLATGDTILNNVAFNYPTSGTPLRHRWFGDTITATGNSAIIDQGFFVNRLIGGTGTLSGEFNNIVSDYLDTAGGPNPTFTGSMELFEATDNLYTAHGGVTDYLALHHVYSTGSVTGSAFGVSAGLTNDNTSAGGISTYIAYGLAAMQGASTVLPTNYLFLQNRDVNAGSALLGNMTLGSVGTAGANTKFEIQGTAAVTGPPATAATAFEMLIRSVSGSNLVVVNDSGITNFLGTVTLGGASVNGDLELFNGSPGGIINLEVATGVTANHTLFLPNSASNPDTLVSLGSAPVFTSEITTKASATGGAGLNLPPGVAPTSPVNGDMWATSSGVFAQVAGATVGPFGTGGGGSGTVTSVVAGAGLTGGTITASGTIALDFTAANTWTNTVTIATAAATNGLQLTGADNSGSTFAIRAQNLAGNNVFSVTEAGFGSFSFGLNVGLTGTNTGAVSFFGTTSGSIKIAPVSPAIVSNKTIFMPISTGSTDSFALIGTPQTYTAALTMGAGASITYASLPSGTAATFACFTSGGLLISSATACP